jgi:hypothetical protein
LEDPPGFSLPNIHNGNKGMAYLENMLNSESSLATYFICSNLIHTDKYTSNMKQIQQYLSESGIPEEKSEDVSIYLP